MKTLLVIFSLFITLQNGISQSILTESKWVGTQISLFTDFKDYYQYSIRTEPQNGIITNITLGETGAINPGFGLKKINTGLWYQEYALIALNIRKTDELGILTIPGQGFQEPLVGRFNVATNINLRWEFGKYFELSPYSRLYPSFGIGIDPFFHYSRIIPKTSAGFPYHYQRMGAIIRADPGLAYRFTANLLLQLKFPLGLWTLYRESYRIDNPISTQMERSGKSFKGAFGLFDLQSSIGLSFRL